MNGNGSVTCHSKFAAREGLTTRNREPLVLPQSTNVDLRISCSRQSSSYSCALVICCLAARTSKAIAGSVIAVMLSDGEGLMIGEFDEGD